MKLKVRLQMKRYIWRSIPNVEIKIVDLLPLPDDDWGGFQADSTMITYFI